MLVLVSGLSIFRGDDLLLYFSVSEGEQESWPMKMSFRVIPGAPYSHWTSMDHGTEWTLCVDMMIYCLIAFRLRHTWTYLDLLYSFEKWLLEPVLVERRQPRRRDLYFIRPTALFSAACVYLYRLCGGRCAHGSVGREGVIVVVNPLLLTCGPLICLSFDYRQN